MLLASVNTIGCWVFFVSYFSCVVYVPVDVVKERLQVQRPSRIATPTALNHGGASGAGIGAVKDAPMRPYRGSADTLKTILRTEGLRGIYKVRPPTGSGKMLFSIILEYALRVVCSPWGAYGVDLVGNRFEHA